ncbi:protein white-like isoform X1 [Ostrea edulis]|uniref:protein white-like isoform X1 n=1 Tax=Ostrea edulis TaxID=37623 RepID=UPI0024AEBC4C|nr:protein white-like isoform X1 [Ostrea edulis]
MNGIVTNPGFSGEDVELGSQKNRHDSVLDEHFEPVTLTWRNVNVYTVPNKGGCCNSGQEKSPWKQILKDVCGMIKPGKLMAVMGASGAGKSTMMNVLTNRNRGTLISEGDIRVNGMAVDKTQIANISAYVQQDDLFIGTLTVREHLTFRALLRMDKRKHRTERLQIVEDLMQELGLTKCAETIIGLPGRTKGISGGEMKRLSFASELLTNPPLMFCDEATSGLDSFMAGSVIQALKSMVRNGRTILCTIHQPSSEVFELFDEIFLLAEGRVAFTGSISDGLQFFKNNGHSCPMNYNPADHFVLTVAIVPGKETERKERVKKLCDNFKVSETYTRMAEGISELSDHQHVSKEIEDHLNDSTRYEAPIVQQVKSLFWRSWVTAIRDPLIVRVKFIQTIFFAVVLGLVYLKTDDAYSQDDIMNMNGVIFIMITNISFTNIFSVLNVFPIEVPIFLREYGTGLYSVAVYYMSKTITEIPFLIAIPVIYMSILYWMSGLYRDGSAYLIATGIAIVVANASSSFGYVISAAAPTVTVALSIAPAFMILFLLFGGFFLNSGSIPDYLVWMKYISWFSYGNEMMVINQWEDVSTISCDSSTSCLSRGDLVITSLSFDKDNFYLDLGLLFVLIAVFRLVAFIILYIRVKRSSA